MKLVDSLRTRTRALKVADLAEMFGVSPQHVYKLAASGRIPSFRVSGAVRFDPGDVASWLQDKQGPVDSIRRTGTQRAA